MLNKPIKIRSKKITQFAKGQHCTLRTPQCNGNPETVVFCHLPGNKGTGTKNHDVFGVHACHLCHTELDNGRVDAKDQLRALQETLLRAIRKGLIKIE